MTTVQEMRATVLKVARMIANHNQFDSWVQIVRPAIEWQCENTSREQWVDVHLVRAEGLFQEIYDLAPGNVPIAMREFSAILDFACASLADGALDPDSDPAARDRVLRARNEALSRAVTVAWWEMMGYDRSDMETPAEYYPD